jgi:hypothetical protein
VSSKLTQSYVLFLFAGPRKTSVRRVQILALVVNRLSNTHAVSLGWVLRPLTHSWLVSGLVVLSQEEAEHLLCLTQQDSLLLHSACILFLSFFFFNVMSPAVLRQWTGLVSFCPRAEYFKFKGWALQWLTYVILATWELAIWKITVQGQPGQKVSENPPSHPPQPIKAGYSSAHLLSQLGWPSVQASLSKKSDTLPEN